MFLEGSFSAVGRTTQGTLDSLRRQLGPGIDPAWEYQPPTPRAAAAKSRPRPQSASSEPSLDALKSIHRLERALQEAVDGGRTIEDIDHRKEEDDDMCKLWARGGQSHLRPSAWVKAQTRSDRALNKPDHLLCGPPVGSYRPKDHVIQPRCKTADFNEKPRNRSQLADLTIDLRPSSAELSTAEHVPERVKLRVVTPMLGKYTGRKSITERENINFNINTFTAGVLDGDKLTSRTPREPAWDFGLSQTIRSKPGESHFQPGRYAKAGNVDAVREKGGKVGMAFHKQRERPAFSKSAPPHGFGEIPDRSLHRKCGAVVPRLLGPDLDRQANRKQMSAGTPQYHRKDDPDACASVHQFAMTFHPADAEKSLLKRPVLVDNMEKALRREQAIVGQRSFGNDATLRKSRSMQDVRSVEVMPVDHIHKKGKHNAHPRILTREFKSIQGRENERQAAADSPPSRQRDYQEVLRFARDARDGDARMEVSSLSPLARSVTQLRKDRKYDELPLDHHHT